MLIACHAGVNRQLVRNDRGVLRFVVQKTIIYTDGGCHGNPGPGAWAYVAVDGDGEGRRIAHEAAGGAPQTTNNQMELDAVIHGLTWVSSSHGTDHPVIVRTDSQYVRNGITSWIHTWMKNGWRTSNRSPVKNRERWQALHELASCLSVSWEWVRGHAGDELNERCDSLVQQAIRDLDSRAQ